MKQEVLQLASLPFVMLIAGCGVLGSDNMVELRPNQGCYHLESDPVVSLEVSNATDSPIYYICTGQIYLEEFQLNGHRGCWLVHGFEECYSAIQVDQGGTENFKIDLKNLFGSGLLAGATFDETVTYRLKMALFEDELFKDVLDDDQQLTVEFQVIQG
ncbi:MAG: hypothetical protein U9Q77_01910 [Candidatus Marinimicrobia bacterium]|nr:hypothetical protein [Candidatus Neomarinimicrobiota bacterium]